MCTIRTDFRRVLTHFFRRIKTIFKTTGDIHFLYTVISFRVVELHQQSQDMYRYVRNWMKDVNFGIVIFHF